MTRAMHDRRNEDGSHQGLTPLLEIFQRLLASYGPQRWWPGETPLEIVVGAILTQATSWANVERALERLLAAGLLDEAALLTIPESELALHIRPAGFFRIKARRLRAFFDAVAAQANGNLLKFLEQEQETLRRTLLNIEGIGPETADAMLLYAAGYPSFVVDRYTERIFQRLGWWKSEPMSYSEQQRWFHERLPKDPVLFNELHALLVCHAKESCRTQPLCQSCCLQERCAYGQSVHLAP